MRWTSLQPNVFSNFYLAPAAAVVRRFRETGEVDTLRLIASKDAPVGIIDPDEVGVFAARLLCERDPGVHDRAKYVMAGPEDITGEGIVRLVEGYIGRRVERVVFEDMAFVDDMAAASQESKNVILSIKQAAESAWAGQCTASTTSREVLELAAPVRTPAEVLKSLLGE